MSKVKIENSILDGTVNLPPSKSAAHRALICSFLSGAGTVSPLIESKDMQATLSALTALKNDEGIINCIESGSTLRFMIPTAAALGKSVTFIGEGKLPERPIGEYLRLLPEHNVKCVTDGTLPLTVEGQLKSGRFEIAGDISSQYITGLLLALPILDGDSEIVLTTPLQSKPYVDMTLRIMSDYGVEVTKTENGYYIKGSQKYIARNYNVEGDWSQAAFFAVAGALFGRVRITGVDFDSTQGDKKIVDIIEQFGAKVERGKNEFTVYKSKLHGIETDATDIPDMVPALAVAGAYAEGTTVIKGAERLRLKESDRIESVTYNLKKLGADITPTPDGMIIKHSNLIGAELKGYNDHRIVMAMTVAATGANGESVIDDAESINKSYPAFFEDYNNLGGKANVIGDRR